GFPSRARRRAVEALAAAPSAHTLGAGAARRGDRIRDPHLFLLQPVQGRPPHPTRSDVQRAVRGRVRAIAATRQLPPAERTRDHAQDIPRRAAPVASLAAGHSGATDTRLSTGGNDSPIRQGCCLFARARPASLDAFIRTRINRIGTTGGCAWRTRSTSR